MLSLIQNTRLGTLQNQALPMICQRLSSSPTWYKLWAKSVGIHSLQQSPQPSAPIHGKPWRSSVVLFAAMSLNLKWNSHSRHDTVKSICGRFPWLIFFCAYSNGKLTIVWHPPTVTPWPWGRCTWIRPSMLDWLAGKRAEPVTSPDASQGTMPLCFRTPALSQSGGRDRREMVRHSWWWWQAKGSVKRR